MDKNLFNGTRLLNNDTLETLAAELKITYATLVRKINGKSEFTASEIRFFMKRWSLPSDQVTNIFLW